MLFLLGKLYSQIQVVDIKYIKGSYSEICVEESYEFKFSDVAFVKMDLFDNSEISGFSKITQTNYDKRGHYFEIRSDRFVLNEYGVNEYRKLDHYMHKIVYERRGGNVLYVYELNKDTNVGKFYFTQQGYSVFCN